MVNEAGSQFATVLRGHAPMDRLKRNHRKRGSCRVDKVTYSVGEKDIDEDFARRIAVESRSARGIRNGE
jgi:hypothetical protein